MRRAVASSVLCSTVLLGSIVGSSTAGAAKAPAVTGCTAVTPAELQAVFEASFLAGAQAREYSETACRFSTSPSSAVPTPAGGSVVVDALTGAKGAVQFKKMQKFYKTKSPAPLSGVGKQAFSVSEGPATNPVPTITVVSLGKRGYVLVSGNVFKRGTNTALSTPASNGQLANQILDGL